MRKADFFKTLDEKQVKCYACCRKCVIEDGKTGFCGVRGNIDGELFLLVYGKAGGIAVDPIEKKPLYHFMPGTSSLSIGAFGCNFSCVYCQNHVLSQSARKMDIACLPAEGYPPEMLVQTAIENNCPSISYTYSEPTVWIEYCLDTMKLAREKEIRNVFVSNGYQSRQVMNEILPLLDAVNVDLKSFSDTFYKKFINANLMHVLQNIEKFHESDTHLEMTTLLIPGLNDSDKEIKQIADFIVALDSRIPWHINRFFPMYKMSEYNPTPLELLWKAYEIGKDRGVKYIYVGNAAGRGNTDTKCLECGSLIVKRSGYQISTFYTKAGKCPKCGMSQRIAL